MELAAEKVSLLRINGTEIKVSYHKEISLPMLFNVVTGSPSSALLSTNLATEQVAMSVSDEQNKNMNAAQNELLSVHQRYAHANMQWCQDLRRKRKYKLDGKIVKERPVLPPKLKDSRCCDIRVCAVCQLGKMKGQ
mmetsp:Transcript_9985/g.29547  ORF Transcript_9985/g.29547 Transcript_9985/m.29547 type:complete len:136 (-) Transcript_9985:106-513(-)